MVAVTQKPYELFFGMTEDDGELMHVNTTRFGEILVNGGNLLRLPEGLLGFEAVHDYCLLRHGAESAFYWLQAVEEPELAFVVVNPFDFFVDYDIEISDADLEALEISTPDEVLVLTLVTFGDGVVTTNLVGPIVVNTRTRAAKQVVLAASPYGTRHALTGGARESA